MTSTSDSSVEAPPPESGTLARSSAGSRSSRVVSPTLEVALLLGALALPFVGADPYWATLLTKFFAFAVLAISVDLIWGYGGLLPFGQAAIFGLGAYAGAIALREWGAVGGAWAGLLLAILVPATLGLVLAMFLFTGRSQVVGFAFGIVTLALGLALQLIVNQWSSLTGGSNGLYGYDLPQLIPGMALVQGTATYYTVLAGGVLAYLVTRWIVGSHFGLVLVSSSEDERRTAALGHSVGGIRTATLVVSFGLAGFAGWLYVPSGFATPSLLGLGTSTAVLVWVALGGRGTLLGAVLGAVSLSLLEEYLTGRFLSLSTLFMGILLVLVVLAWPSGLLGAVRAVGAFVRRRLGGRRRGEGSTP